MCARRVCARPVASEPTQYEYSLSLPEGASLEAISDGSVAVVGSDGIVIGLFAAPWAKDATGAAVPTHYEIEGTALTQVVQHGSAAYPVVADPFWIPLFGLVARWTTHALNQAAKRNISHQAIQRAVQEGKSKPGNQAGTTLFNHNGIYVVVNNKTGAIITTYTAGGGGM